MKDRISVQLTGPAKIEGKLRKAGEDVTVTPAIARDLAAAGVIAEGEAQAIAELAPGMPGFDAAVTEQARLLADAMVGGAVEAAVAELTADRDAARARAADAEAEVSRQHAQIMAHEAEIADLEAARASLAAELAAITTPDEQGDGTAAATKGARKKASEAKG